MRKTPKKIKIKPFCLRSIYLPKPTSFLFSHLQFIFKKILASQTIDFIPSLSQLQPCNAQVTAKGTGQGQQQLFVRGGGCCYLTSLFSICANLVKLTGM